MMGSMTKRRLLVGLLAVVALAAVACDRGIPPITIQNSTGGIVSVSFSLDRTDSAIRVRQQDGGPFSDSVGIASGETRVIYLDGVSLDAYTLVAKDFDRNELFRRTFLEEELDQRDWKLEITPEGIQ